MFEKFTQSAIKTIMLAQEESRRLKHDSVDGEHFLLGLIGEGRGIAAQSLKTNGVNLKTARIAVKESMGLGKDEVRQPFFHSWMQPCVEVPFTPRSKNILALSLSMSKELGKTYISTEHLLLAIIRDGELDSSKGSLTVLRSLGVDIKELKRNVRERISRTD